MILRFLEQWLLWAFFRPLSFAPGLALQGRVLGFLAEPAELTRCL